MIGVNVKLEESALYDSQSNGLAENAVKDVKDAVRTNLACLVRRFGQEFSGGHPVLTWLVKYSVKYSVAMVNTCRRGQDGKTAYELRKGRKFVRALPHFYGQDPLHDTWSHERMARVESRWEDRILLGVSEQSDELYLGTDRRHAQSDVARPQNELSSRS